jgi:hypothetical protein
MADYILVRHKVQHFSQWKRAFDAYLSKRTEAGLTQKYLFQSMGNPEEITLLFEVTDLVRAKTFIESSELKNAMLKAGIADRPDIYFLQD